MRYFILAAALTLASRYGLAASITCDKPEYLQLKTADKAELTEEYCRAKRKFDQVLSRHASLIESIDKNKYPGRDVSKELDQGRADLDAGMSCSKASADYMGALERRFKLRQRPTCK